MFWTVVGLGLSFKKSGLDLDRKIWQSANLCWICADGDGAWRHEGGM